MVLSDTGWPLRRGEPEYTDDERFWDGERLYRQRLDLVRKGEARLLRSAVVVVEARMDCCPGLSGCGSKRIVGDAGRQRLQEAGFVRFRDAEGHLEVWDAEDGTVLALLVGEVTRPPIG